MSNSLSIRTVGTDSDLLACFSVRFDVFVTEQQVPFVLEVDARDYLPSTVHLVACEANQPVGTMRIIKDSAYSYHLGRIAVLKHVRGRGLGRSLVQKAHEVLSGSAGEYALRNGNNRLVEITLDAQEYAIPFYERLGYETTDRKRFLDAGIWHREMRQILRARSGE